MPFNGAGAFSVVYSFVADAAAGIKILAARQDTQWADVANNGLSNVICKDGQTVTTAVIPFAAGISIGGNETLSTYDVGTWTPTDASGAGLTLTVTSATYTRIGRMVALYANITYPVTASGAAALLGGNPFTPAANNSSPSVIHTNASASLLARVNAGAATVEVLQIAAGAASSNATLSASFLRFCIIYFV